MVVKPACGWTSAKRTLCVAKDVMQGCWLLAPNRLSENGIIVGKRERDEESDY
nr:MAG TPA: hypothetical protein [Caudoviricetes sp.]